MCVVPFVVSEDSNHIALFYMVDAVGNVETQKSITFTIQKEASLLFITIKNGVGV